MRFGRFTIDAGGENPRFDGQPLRLRRKAREVLAILAARQGHVVTIDELLDSVWPGLAVTPHSVTVIISTLRRLLARDESRSCRIESVYGSGYRFILRTDGPAAPDAPQEESGDVVANTRRCIAREPEIARLERSRDMVREGISRVVLLGGDAGIGKSSVIREFTRRTRESTDALVYTGHCQGLVGTPEPYQPVLEILEGLERGLGSSDLAQRMRRFAPTWLVQFPQLSSPDELVALRESLAGTHAGRVLRELRRLLEDIAGDRSVVVIIEDLHCAEAATVEFVRSLAATPLAARLLLVATYRPLDAVVGRSEVLGLRGTSQQVANIDLDPWDAAGIDRYLTSRFGAKLPPTFVADIERRSRGIPLLVSALLDAMVRDGRIEKDGGRWIVDESVDARYAPLPEEIRALARQQLDLLPTEDRQLLETAAAFGEEFFSSDVAAAARIDPEDCADRLAELCEYRFFIDHNDPLAADGDHVFLHETFRQAILESLPAARSRKLHRQAAEQIEKSPGDRWHADDLAHKFAVGQAWSKAAGQWERAAAKAAQQYAHAEAAACVRRAIEAIEHARPSRKRDSRLADRHLDLANLSIAASGYADPSVIDAFARARRFAESCQAEKTAFRARAGEAIVAAVNGRLEEATEHCPALTAAGRKRPKWRSMASLYVAWIVSLQGELAHAAELSDEGLRWLARAEPGMPALRDLGISLATQRMSLRALTHDDDSWIRQAEEIVESLPSTALEDTYTYYVLARTAVLVGRNDLARDWAARCLEIADSMGDSGFAVRSRVLAAFAGDRPLQEKVQSIGAALAIPADLDSRLDVGLLWLLLAELQIRSGDLGAARDSVEAADAVAFPWNRSVFWRVTGDLAVAAADTEFDLLAGARPGGIIESSPAPLDCYRRAAEVARSQRAVRLVRFADEAAEKLRC